MSNDINAYRTARNLYEHLVGNGVDEQVAEVVSETRRDALLAADRVRDRVAAVQLRTFVRSDLRGESVEVLATSWRKATER